MKLIGYIRLSPEEPPESQYNQLHTYCNLFNIDLIDIVQIRNDSAAGHAGTETYGNSIIASVKSNRADGIVVQRLERFFPQQTEALIVAIRLRQHGLTIHVVNDYINTATLTGWLGIALKAYVSQYPAVYHSTTSPSPEAPVVKPDMSEFLAPFGCVRMGSALFRDPTVWLVREKVVHLYRKEGIAIEDIISQLQSRGVTSPGGRPLWCAADIIGLLRYHDILGKLPLHRGDN
jgi:hypothetical protein